MVATVFPADAVAGEPAYSGRELRQVHASALAGATAARPLGARSGVRPGTSTTTVTATSTTWTVRPFAGVIDGEAAVEAGPYWFAFDANTTGAVTAANATNPRIDIVYVRVDDPAEGDGTAAPAVAIGYLAGTAAASPVAPATPARSFAIARINVPASGGGSPSVTWVAPYAAAAGGIIPVRTTTERDALAALANTDCAVYVDVLGTLWVCNDGTTFQPVNGGPIVQATKSAAQDTVGAGPSNAIVLFNTETIDTDGMHSTSTNTSRLTCTRAGYYRIIGKAAAAVTGLGYTVVTLYKNGSALAYTSIGAGPATGAYTRPATSALVALNVGDYIEVHIAISAGASAIDPGSCLLEAEYVRPL